MKYLKYLKYLVRHKWFVFVQCCKFGIPWRGLVHDIDKFLPCEFIGFADEMFGEIEPVLDGVNYSQFEGYGRSRKRDTLKQCAEIAMKHKELRENAWNLHLIHSDHHWQSWLMAKCDWSNGMQYLIPDACIKELVADWVGELVWTQRKYKNRKWTLRWFLMRVASCNELVEPVFHPETLRKIEELLKRL